MSFDFANGTATDYARHLNSKRHPDDCMKLVEAADFWASVDIYTASQLRRDLAVSSYSDFFKEQNGFRPRLDWSKYTADDIELMYDDLFTDAFEADNADPVAANTGPLTHNPFVALDRPGTWSNY